MPVELNADLLTIALEAALARVVNERVAVVDQEPPSVQRDAGVNVELGVERHDVARKARDRYLVAGHDPRADEVLARELGIAGGDHPAGAALGGDDTGPAHLARRQ